MKVINFMLNSFTRALQQRPSNYDIPGGCCCRCVIPFSVICGEDSWTKAIQVTRHSCDDFVVQETKQNGNAQALQADENRR